MHILRPLRRVALSVVGLTMVAGCFDDPVSIAPPPPVTLEAQVWATPLNVDLASMTKVRDGLYIKDDVVGTGATATATSQVHMFYVGRLANGIVFDDVVAPEAAVPFDLAGNLIPGFKLGAVGMKVGGKRRIIMHSSLAYAEFGSGPIPGNANLVFDVELASIP